MTTTHIVREATLADVPEIAKVHVDAWRETYEGLMSQRALTSHSYADREALWNRALAPGSATCLFVAESDGEIVGFAAGGPSHSAVSGFGAELYAIYLLDRVKRRGAGRALFDAVRSRLRERAFKRMLLWVLDGNEAAAFYEAQGGARFHTGPFTLAGDSLVEHGYGFEL